HFHENRRHRLRPHEDRLQNQGRRRAQSWRNRRLHRRQRRRFRRPQRGRIRNVRRYRRRAHHFHLARREKSHRAGPIARLDFRYAHRDARGQRRGLLHQRRHRQSALRQRRRDELRNSAHFARLDYLPRFHRIYVRRLVAHHPNSRRRFLTVVEARHHHLLRHAGRRYHSRVGESLHLHRIAPRQRSRSLRRRRRRLS